MAWEPHASIKGPKGDIPIIESPTQPVETEVLWVDVSDPGDSGGGTPFDTGWRDVSGLMHPDWEGTLRARRIGPLVILAPGLVNAGETDCFTTEEPIPHNVLTLPVGWRPSALVSLDGWATQMTPGGVLDTSPGNSASLPAPLGEGYTWTTDDPEPDPGDWPGTPWSPEEE